jgi:hypothetical protein
LPRVRLYDEYGNRRFSPQLQEVLVKQLFTLTCALLLVLSVGASAQDVAGKFSVSPFAGIGMPMGDMADDDPEAVINGDAGFRKMGIKFGIAGEYYAAPNYAFGISFRYASFGSKDLTLPEPIGTFESDSKLTAMIFAVHGKYIFIPDGVTRPYGILGGGLGMAKFTDVEGDFYGVEDPIDFDAMTKPFMFGGLGVDYFASPTVSIFGEVTFDYAFIDGTKLEADGVEYQEMGANYYFVDIVAGIRVFFGGSGE